MLFKRKQKQTVPTKLDLMGQKLTLPELTNPQAFSNKLLKEGQKTLQSSYGPSAKTLIFRFGIAVLLPTVAYGLNELGRAYLVNFDARFLLFFGAITLTALKGGFPPTVLATITSIILLYYSLDLPFIAPPDRQVSLQMLIFVLEGLAIGWSAQSRLAAEAEKARLLLLEHQARMEAELSRDQRDEFIALASHEIKTPLTAIKGFNELLQKHLKNNKNPKILEYLGFMKEQVDRLTTLVIDFLDTTKIRTGKLEINKVGFNFKELLEQTVSSLEPIASRHRIVITKCDPVIVKADRTRIGQVLTNLLTNAIKYSLPTKQVIINVLIKDNELVVSIQDFGIGIASDDQHKIFDIFFQSTDPARPSRGLGLGLFITSEIVHLHGGKIWVSSVKGEGSTFFFTLPGILGNKNG